MQTLPLMFKTSKNWFFISVMIVTVLLCGCATGPLRKSVPASLEQSSQVPGISSARFWGDAIPQDIEKKMQTMTRAEMQVSVPALFERPHSYLAISGGGANGAFGAGVLVGWTQTKKRPIFQMVTGISTGALIAPWAFLGSSYDPVLKEVYTTISTQDIMRQRSWFVVPFSDAVADSTPLLNLIRRYFDDEVMAAIANAHRTGRRLYIGTTDLDQMRPRIWDIGAIVSSGHPGAKQLVHNILLASASIPGVFPPVRIEVEADGQLYDELHVDGGTTSQVFVYPAALDWRRLLKLLEVPGAAHTYVIRNSTLKPTPIEITPKLIPITGRSISSLIRTQGIGDLYLIYLLTRRDGGNYRLAYIPDDFDEEPKEPFDNAYMKKLFDRGYQMANQGFPWAETPPGWKPDIKDE